MPTIIRPVLEIDTNCLYVSTMTSSHGSPHVADLPQGPLSYRAAGPVGTDHPPVVFVHGLLVDGQLWTAAADLLADRGVRSYAPTLPLGSHSRPMRPDADLTPRGIARLVLDFLDSLGLEDV